MSERKRETGERLSDHGAIASFREKFGTLLTSNALSVYRPAFRGHGDRILINTKSKAIRNVEEGGTGFIDFALTPAEAIALYESLGRTIDDWRKNQQKKK